MVTDTTTLETEEEEETLFFARKRRLTFGVSGFIPWKSNKFLTLNFGPTMNFISEEINDFSPKSFAGMVTSVGLLYRPIPAIGISGLGGYDHALAGNDIPIRDWSGFFFRAGLIINIATD